MLLPTARYLDTLTHTVLRFRQHPRRDPCAAATTATVTKPLTLSGDTLCDLGCSFRETRTSAAADAVVVPVASLPILLDYVTSRPDVSVLLWYARLSRCFCADFALSAGEAIVQVKLLNAVLNVGYMGYPVAARVATAGFKPWSDRQALFVSLDICSPCSPARSDTRTMPDSRTPERSRKRLSSSPSLLLPEVCSGSDVLHSLQQFVIQQSPYRRRYGLMVKSNG